MESGSIIERLRDIAQKAAEGRGLELVHVEVAGTKRDSVVRVYIDKEGGVTLEDCSNVSRDMEAVLDAEDLIPNRYVLEVSSPGIERQLYTIDDFKKFIGRLTRIRTRAAIDGQRTFAGTITSVDGDEISFEDRNRGTMTLSFSEIEKANLKIDLSQEFKGR